MKANMRRTQIQLTEAQWKGMKQLAAQRGVSFAELVREAIEDKLRQAMEVTRQERWERAMAAAGRFHSGHHDLAREHDDHLAEAYES